MSRAGLTDPKALRVLEELSRGRRAVVSRAFHTGQRATVVLKAMAARTPEEAAALERAHRLAGTIDSPHVVRQLELVPWGDGLAALQEDFGGRPLAALLADGPLSLDAFFAVSLGLARALQAIHAAGLVHGRLDPTHVLVAPGSFDTRVIGLAGARSPGATAPAPLTSAPEYLAPEQLGRLNRAVDERADLYSAGLLYYALLAGAGPVPAGDVLDVAYAQAVREPGSLRAHRPQVPEGVERLIAWLLARAPEDRPASAAVLIAALEACADRQPGAPGLAPPTLSLPSRLCGRRREQAALRAAVEDLADRGEPAVLLLTGEAGAGKSRLLGELRSPERVVAVGKHEQFGVRAPFGALVRAVTDLLRRVLGEERAVVDAWGARLRAGLGCNAGMLARRIPALGVLLPEVSPEEPVADASLTEGARLLQALEDVVHALATPAQPLVLVLEDLQWIDPPSLELLRLLTVDRPPADVLVVGTYRPAEVSSSHPLRDLLQALPAAGRRVVRVAVDPLELDEVAEFAGEALGRPLAEVEPLAAQLHRASGGNPLLLGELLKELVGEEALASDARDGTWRWRRADAAAPARDLVQVTGARLARLGRPAVEALAGAAALGSRFEARVLARGLGRPAEDVERDLGLAVEAELLAPIAPAGEETWLRFVHDRFQEAALAALGAAKTSFCLDLGRRLLADDAVAAERGDVWLQAVGLVNAFRANLTDAAERLELARANVEAGRSARRGHAPGLAAEHARVALEEAGDLGEPARRAVALDARTLLAEAALLAGDAAAADAHAQAALALATSNAGRLRAWRLRVVARVHREDWTGAVALGLAAFDEEGGLPGADQEDVDEVLAEATRALRELYGDPASPPPALPDHEEHVRERLALACDLFSPAYVARPGLLPILAAEAVRLSATHGESALTATACNLIGTYVGLHGGDRGTGHDLCALAAEASARFGDPGARGRLLFTFAGLSRPWREPFAGSLPMLDEAYAASRAAGDPLYAGYARLMRVMVGLAAGWRLDDVAAAADAIAHEAPTNPARPVVVAVAELCRLLAGRSHDARVLDLDGEADAAWVASLEAASFGHGLHVHGLCKGWARLLLGRPGVAAPLAAAARAAPAATGQLTLVDLALLEALASADAHPGLGPGGEALCAARRQMSALAALAPDNYAARSALIEAELAARAGDALAALERFDAAIDLAVAHGLRHDEALARERAGRALAAAGLERAARGYLRGAAAAYGRWGAAAKVAQLSEEFPDVFGLPAGGGDPPGSAMSPRQLLDLAALTRAARILAAEVELAPLLEQLLRLALRVTASQQAHVLLGDGERLVVEASLLEHRGESRFECAPRRLGEVDLPVEVVRYVARTRAPLVVDTATRVTVFPDAPYFAAGRPLTALALPIEHGERLLGVLYLESRIADDAYSEADVQALSLVLPHAAIALQNAALYAELVHEIEQRKAAEAALADHAGQLEELVAERTRALESAQQELVRRERLATLGRMAATVNHEIRNPLATIRTSVYLLQQACSALTAPPLAARALGRMDTALTRCERIAAEMSDFARVPPLERAPTALDPWVERLVRDDLAAPAAVEVGLELAAGGRVVDLDAELVRGAVVNVFQNACQALVDEHGEPLAPGPCRVTVSTEGRGSGAAVRIRDTGPGIAADDLARVFEPLFSTKSFGVGMGMAIVKRTLERHGGGVELASAPGEGTTVTLWFPGPANEGDLGGGAATTHARRARRADPAAPV